MEQESKVMAKYQAVTPKSEDAAQIEVGDVLKWLYEDGRIMINSPLKVSLF